MSQNNYDLDKYNLTTKEIEAFNSKGAGTQKKIIEELDKTLVIDNFLIDKIDSQSFFNNVIAFLMRPVEWELRSAMAGYRKITDNPSEYMLIDLREVQSRLAKKLKEQIISYRANGFAGHDSSKGDVLNKLEKVLGMMVSKKPDEEIKPLMNEIYQTLKKNKQRDFIDAKIIFSKICAINQNLGYSTEFNVELESSAFISSYLWDCLVSIVNYFSGGAKVLGDSFDALSRDVAEVVSPREKRIDDLIAREKQSSQGVLAAEELSNLELYHDISKAYSGYQKCNWYDLYEKHYKAEGLLPGTTSWMLFSSESKNDKKALETIEKTLSTPQATMHHVHQVLGQIKIDYKTELNQEGSLLKKEMDELESELRQIKFPLGKGESLESNNTAVFKKIQEVLTKLQGLDILSTYEKPTGMGSSFKKIKDTRVTLNQLETAIKSLKTAVDHVQTLKDEADSYISQCYNGDSNELRRPPQQGNAFVKQ